MDSSVMTRLQKQRINEASKTLVLVVDPDRASMELTDKHLANYQVIFAERAEEALSKLRTCRRKIDVVLTEFVLPDMEPFEFVDSVHELRNIPVVFLSRFGEIEVIRQCMAAGAKFCFTKPLQQTNANTLWQFRVLNERSLSAADDIWDVSNLGEDEDGIVDNDVSYLDTDQSNSNNWTDNFYYKFIDVVNKIGPYDAQPEDIHAHMNVPGVTLGEIGIHLQKYRLYLNQKQGLKVDNDGAGTSGV